MFFSLDEKNQKSRLLEIFQSSKPTSTFHAIQALGKSGYAERKIEVPAEESICQYRGSRIA